MYYDEYVCLSTHITRKIHSQSSPNFVCMLPLAMALSSSDSVMNCSTLSTSGFVDDITFSYKGAYEPVSSFDKVCQVGASVGRQTTCVWLSSSFRIWDWE